MSYFAHLHLHDQTSFLDAMSRPRELMERVSSIGQTAVATTNHGNMYSVAEMQKVAKQHGLKLISGCEFYVANLGLEDRSARDSYHLTVLCDGSKVGWKNLCNLHHLSFAKGFFYNNRIDLDALAEHNEGLIVLSGCMGGALVKALLAGNEAEAERRLKVLRQIFGPERLFVELQNHGLEGDKVALPWLRKAAKKYGLKTVATNDAHYVNKDDWRFHDILVAIGKNQCIYDPNRAIAYEPEQFFVKDYDEMAEMGFSKAELEQSHKIAETCEPLDLDSKGVFHIPKVENADAVLRKRTLAGLEDKYDNIDKTLKERAEYELSVIKNGGFSDYMLIVAGLYDFMREEKIPYGPGRGSVCGSIVAYAIGIHQVDPIRYGLFFERFLNPDRVSMPDIDIDVSAVHRDRVINYLRETYGDDKTAQLIALQSIGGRAAIRDIGRSFNLPLDKVDELAKAVPQEGSQTKDREARAYLEAALESQKVLREAYESDEKIREIIDAGIRLEGTTKSPSKHAAGIVISDKPLRDLVPMGIKTKGDDPNPNVVGFEMGFIEDMGLIKFDVLGLIANDTIDECIAAMKRAKVISSNFTPNDIPVDDANTFEMLCKGHTEGVFQLEGSGMTGWLRKLQPDRIEDIMAMVALFRPGPMEFIPSYIARKHGKEKVVYPHKSLEPILKETYGIPLYQENLMSIGRTIAGWTLSRADQLRKTVGKKIVDDVAKERKQFADDAAKNGFKWEWADKLFEQFIEPAARYSFNKSHSCAYGLLAYRTAYLKCNYPTFYFAALLKSIEDHPKRDEKMSAYIADAREMGVAILPPDVNVSDFSFTAIPKEKCVRFGLNGIKFVGSKAVQEIIKKRGNGYVDFFETVAALKSQHVTSRVLEALVSSGAMDSLPGNRASKLASLPAAMERADMLKEDQKRIAAGGKPVKRKKPIPEPVLIEGLDDKVQLLAGERELVGYYLSGHPYLDFASSVSASHTIQSAREITDKKEQITIGGIISRLTLHTTKKGKQQMAFGAIEDDKAVLEFIVFPRQYHKLAGILKLDAPLVLSGNIEASTSDDDDSAVAAKLLVSDASPIARGLKKSTKQQIEYQEIITLPTEGYRDLLQKIRKRLDTTQGITDLKFILADGKEVKVVA